MNQVSAIEVFRPDPPENCHFTVKIFIFFKKKCIYIFEKNENFWQFILKKCQVFGNFPEGQVVEKDELSAEILVKCWKGKFLMRFLWMLSLLV